MTNESSFLKPLLTLVIGLFLVLHGDSQVAFAADAPEVIAKISQSEIFVGDTVDLVIEVRNSKNPSPPELEPLRAQFEIASLGDQSRNQSSTMIFNGKVTQQNFFSHIFQYRLTPKVTGMISIPPLTATIDGKELTTDEIDLKVIEPEEQDIVRAEIVVDHDQVYPTQPFNVTLRLTLHPLPDDPNRNPLGPVRNQPPHLQVNWVDSIPGLKTNELTDWLRPLVAEDGVGFTLNNLSTQSNSFFDSHRLLVLNLSKGRVERNDQEGKPYRGFVYELTRSFNAEKAGQYVFGPVSVKGTFVSAIERKEYVGRRIVAIAAARTVVVKDVPTSRPVTFCGGIGQYSITAVASPATLRVGDPLTLTISIEPGHNSGSLDLISAPDLEVVPSFAERFELLERVPTGRVENGIKKFVYALRPKSEGVSIPELKISTFDPQSEEFVENTVAAIPLTVSQSDRMSSQDLVSSSIPASKSTLRSRSEGIFQNITDVREIRNERINGMAWGGTAVASWGIAFAVVAVVNSMRRRAADPVLARRQQARRAAARRLADAQTSFQAGNHRESMALVRTAITELIADLQNRHGQALTKIDVINSLKSANVADSVVQDADRLFDGIEAAEYGAASSIDSRAAIDSAEALIRQIADAMEKSRMVPRVLGLAFALLLTQPAWASEQDSLELTFLRALELFDEAKTRDDYDGAAQLLEKIVADGTHSGAVYYNLGNAYFRAGEFGRAILNYRKAKPYRPTDPYLAANLDQAISAAPGRLTAETPAWWQPVFFWSNWIAFPRKVQIMSVLAISAAVIFLLSHLFRRPRGIWISVTLLGFSAVMGLEFGLSYSDSIGADRAVIVAETIARKGTGQSYEPAFDQPLRDGAEFRVLNQTAGWTFGHFPNVGDGWVKNEFVAR